MSGLFGNNLPPARRTSGQKPKVELPPNNTPEQPAPGPVFGTPAWDRCPCGAWATLFFPLAGGIRRCTPCATREGRMRDVPARK